MFRKWKGKFRIGVSIVISILVLLVIIITVIKANASITKSYNFNNMTFKSTGGVTYSISDSSAELIFSRQNTEIKFQLPETLDMTQCTNIAFNASSPKGDLTFKLYDTSGNQATKYDFNSSLSNSTFKPESTSQINCIGIMAASGNYSATINSITFTMDSDATFTPTPVTATLLNTYGKGFSYSGTAVNLNQLMNFATLNEITSQYNSITVENEMKPDAVLGGSPTLMSTYQAKANGYYIPSDYAEDTIPTLNFSKLDSILLICHNNGLKLRAHTLIWHAQTPDWFFRTGYGSNGNYVSEPIMNARMEMYIKTYMNHVYKSNYSKVVYAWDVVNEYFHAKPSGWSKIYGENLGTSPEFVKRAFQYAYECLDTFGLTNSVSLFYNDFNTYQIADNIVSLIKYINSEKKLCNGVGMQSHLSTTYPSVAIYKAALQKFLNAGFEVQITELDVGNTSPATQASYIYDLLSEVISAKKSGGNITGVTWWGLYDNVSWRASTTPLIFSKPNTPKDSYYKALKAYTDARYKVND